jgi:hypothetical protein
MLTIATNFQVYASSSNKQKKELKKFRKFGKRIARERRVDFERMADKMKDIAKDEERRTKELLKQHREFFEKRVGGDDVESTSIDFYEK